MGGPVDEWTSERISRSFLVPRKVRFLAMTMSEQARHCSFGLTKTFFSRSSKSAFSRHDNVRASSTLFIWLNENVRIIAPIMFSLIAHAGALPLFLSPKSPVLRFVKKINIFYKTRSSARLLLEKNVLKSML